jgi:hypothetical protein
MNPWSEQKMARRRNGGFAVGRFGGAGREQVAPEERAHFVHVSRLEAVQRDAVDAAVERKDVSKPPREFPSELCGIRYSRNEQVTE